MTRFATLRQTDTAAPFAALGPRLAAPEAAAAKLARALFTGFPGESGRTITVR